LRSLKVNLDKMLMLPPTVHQDSGQVTTHSCSRLCPWLARGTSHPTLQRELYTAKVTSGGRGPLDFARRTTCSVLQTAEKTLHHNRCIILHLGGEGRSPAKGNLRLGVLSNDHLSRGNVDVVDEVVLQRVSLLWAGCLKAGESSDKKAQHMVPGWHH